MQEFKDSQGNAWGDFRALREKTNMSAKTAASWVADGIFKAGVHYAQPDEGKKVFYRLDLCADLHKQRLELHKNNLKGGKYLKVSNQVPSPGKKQQLNLQLTQSEIEVLRTLQEAKDFVRFKEVKCGSLVLRSEAEPLSITGIATELLRKSIKEQMVRIYGEEHREKIMGATNA